VLLSEGKRVKSVMLASLAFHSDDPFAKVKQLITDLRWRLEKEEHGEVRKVTWCKEQLKVAQHDRDSRFSEAQDISMQVERLHAREDTLVEAIKQLTAKAKEIALSIVAIFTNVNELSKNQIEMMEDQKAARDELNYAIRLIKSFYSQAAKDSGAPGALLVQVDAQNKTRKDMRAEQRNIHSESKERAVDDGKRQDARSKRNKQRIGDLEGDVPATARMGSLGDALALMETISSDFDREIGNLEGRLDKEHQELVRTNMILKAQQEHAEELAELDTQDLKSVRLTRASKMDDLQTAMDLCDGALKELENLRPTCVDTGMSYSERVKMRETEMAALQKALCILGETDKELCP